MNMKRRIPFCLLVVMLAALLLCGCQSNPVIQPGAPQAGDSVAAETAAPTEEPTDPPTEPTEPPPTSPPDGNPEDVSCKGSYTSGPAIMAGSAQTVVATAGKEQLTNGLLQIYYQMAVNTYREEAHEIAPDFSQTLDTQLCPLEGAAITWQQYFLQQALNSWQSDMAMVNFSKTAQLPLEEAYDRNEEKHAENLRTKIYNLNLLYGYNTDYKIADAHQTYLDNLPETMETLAEELGYKNAASMTKSLAGVGTNDTYLLQYAQLMNEGYMYATTLSYYIEPNAEEVEAWYTQNEALYTQQGITKEDQLINLRHILVLPNDPQIAADGTVTASEAAWASAKKEAENLLAKWNKNKTEDNFAELAFANSDDTGSSVNGGLYTNISKGQLMAEIDAWCFDITRSVGDIEIIKTNLGYHILYLCQPTERWYQQAEADLIAETLANEIATIAALYPVEVDYSAILLGIPGNADVDLSARDLLYPDIAHERFPVAPLYFQQDYPNTMYGNYSLVTYGCGVTTMSMLVSYMTDEEWTPPELCALYGRYCSKAGTAHAMFTEVPVDRGFYCITRVFTWKEALAYLEDGYMVVTLQRNGYWTRGGHYLLLHNLIDVEIEEDGNTKTETYVQVRDSNLYNYKRLDGHTIGYFPLSTIPGNARCYWVYQKKVMNVDSCVRCAEPTEESHAPTALFAESYVCPKCQTAVNRRDAYLEGRANLILPEKVEPAPTEPEAPTEDATEVPTESPVDSDEGTEPMEPDPEPETLPVDPDHDFDAPTDGQ